MILLTLCVAMGVSLASALPLGAWRADPAVRIEDAYKWIHQAAKGGEHAAPSRADASAWLEREWATLEAPAPGEPLIEPLGPWGIVRLNLRPYRALGGDTGTLLDAFLASANEYRPDVARFVALWSALGERLRQGDEGTLTFGAWEQLDSTTKARGYPAVHHSEAYERAHRPAYRVLTAARARELERSLDAR